MKARIRRQQAILTIGRHGAPKVEGKVGGVRWTPTAARNEAKRLLGIIKDGQDPATARAVEKAALMFGELADRYVEEHASSRSYAVPGGYESTLRCKPSARPA